MRNHIDHAMRTDAFLLYFMRLIEVNFDRESSLVFGEQREGGFYSRRTLWIEADRAILVRPRCGDWKTTENAIALWLIWVCSKRQSTH